MKNLKKAIALCLALLLCLTFPVGVSAAEANDAMIDEEAKASLTLWKFDWTNAYKDGVWDEDSFISTGWRESYRRNATLRRLRQLMGDLDHG